jgi:hypothetical protein
MGICFSKDKNKKANHSSNNGHNKNKNQQISQSLNHKEERKEKSTKSSLPIDRSKHVKFVQEPLEQNYEILEKLGEGGNGSVRRARHRTIGVLRAIKTIKKSNIKNLDTLRREFEILMELVKSNSGPP